MANLIRILAVSLGGGVALGAGIRLGERIAQSAPVGHPDSERFTGDQLSAQLLRLEGRLSRIEGVSALDLAPVDLARVDLAGLESRLSAQAEEVAAVREQLDSGGRRAVDSAQTSERLRAELRQWVDQRVDERLRGLETRLRGENDEAQREMLNTVIESVQTRVLHRISRLEEEVTSQAGGMQELRECTMRTEQSMQKLLGGIDRLVALQTASAAAVPPPEKREPEQRKPEPAASAPQSTEVPPDVPSGPVPGGLAEASPEPAQASPRARRWNIFG